MRGWLALVGLAALLLVGHQVVTRAADSTGPAGFHTEGGRILDAEGKPFLVKGVTIPYGTFAGGPGGGPDPGELGQRNFATVPADLRRLKATGVNLVRVMAHPSSDRGRLRQVIRWARAEGLIVELSNVEKDPTRGRPWVTELAREYRGDSGIWLQPVNEPNCRSEGPNDRCGDWKAWQDEQIPYIRAIRAAGVRSPIVVNGPSFSWDLSQVDAYPLGDDDVIYGAHRYANNEPTFSEAQQAEVDRLWGGLAVDHAVIVDEVGAYDGPTFANSPAWTEGFLAYVTDWVQHRGGSGAIGFTWRWYDGNSLTDARGALTPWGQTFDRFLRNLGPLD